MLIIRDCLVVFKKLLSSVRSGRHYASDIMLSKARSSPRRADHIIKHLGLDDVDGIMLMGILQLDQQVVHDAKKDESRLTEWLWNQMKEYHQLALDTPFIQGMKNGTLDPVLFGIYNLQDTVYCYNATKFLSLLAKKSTGVMKKYSKHELSVAESMDPTYSFEAMIPCSRLWPWLGKKLKVPPMQFGVYKEWIDENLTGTGYKLLEKFVQDHSANVDEKKAFDVYQKSMKYEFEFFNSAQKHT
eukprot:gene12376-13649_t